MYCALCGGYVEQDAEFCNNCGRPLYTPEGYSYIIEAPPNLPPQSYGVTPVMQGQVRKRSNLPIVIASVCVGVLLLGAGIFALKTFVFSDDATVVRKADEGQENDEKGRTSEVEPVVVRDGDDGKKESDDDESNSSTVAPVTVATDQPTFNDPSTCGLDEYVMPESSTYEYTREQLEGLTHKQLFYGRNELLCRYGRECRDERLKKYFASRTWFSSLSRIYSADEWDAMYPEDVTMPLTTVEKRNYELIFQIENEKWDQGDRS